MSFKVMFGEVKTKEGDLDVNGNKTIVRYSDLEVSGDDLSMDVFEAIAKDIDAGLTDSGIYKFPRESGSIAWRVVKAAAEQAGIEPPPKPTNMPEVNAIKAMIEDTEDIGDMPMMGGNPPVPGGAGSGSSSTSPGTTTGPELSPEPSPSDGS